MLPNHGFHEAIQIAELGSDTLNLGVAASLGYVTREHFTQNKTQCKDVSPLVNSTARSALFWRRILEIRQSFLRVRLHESQQIVFLEVSYAEICDHNVIRPGVQQIGRL